MAWEISISSQGWNDIYNALGNMTVEQLARAIADDNYEKFHGGFNHPANPHHKGAWNWKKLAKLTHDVLQNEAYKRIEENNTCDNGGYHYWIDREGYHTVSI